MSHHLVHDLRENERADGKAEGQHSPLVARAPPAEAEEGAEGRMDVHVVESVLEVPGRHEGAA
jgi:hypothetical protein